MAGRERAEPGRQTHQWFRQECENPVLCDEVASGQAELTNPLQISLKYAGLPRRPEPYVFHMYRTLETEELMEGDDGAQQRAPGCSLLFLGTAGWGQPAEGADGQMRPAQLQDSPVPQMRGRGLVHGAERSPIDASPPNHVS